MIVDTDAFPASFGQERLWFFHQLDPDLPLYQIVVLVPLPSRITRGQVEEALRRLVRRHETLRTSLDSRDGTLLQVVHDEVPVSVTHHDLTGLTDVEQRLRVQALVTADAPVPFRLDRAPLWRARSFEYGDGDRTLLFVLHHVIADGRSREVLKTELVELCHAVVEGREPRLNPLPIQYGDFAAWQRDQLTNGGLDPQLAYWAGRLGDLPAPLDLPADRPRPAKKTYAGGELVFDVPAETARALDGLARTERATPFVVALAAYGTLLHRLSGQTDILVGSPVDRRGLPELVDLIGMLVNTVVFRLDLSGAPTFRELVRRTRREVFDALDNADVPFDRLVELYQRDRDPSRSPLYQAGFNMLVMPEMAEVDDQPLSNGTAKFDILLDLAIVTRDRLIGRIEYSTDLFDAASAETFAARILRVLTHGLATPDVPIDALSIMDDDERDRVLATGRPAREEPAPDGLITDRFDAVVAAHPDTVAVYDADERRLTYAELDARANRLAHRLVGLGVGPDTRVALCCATDVDLVVAALGVLKAGGCYLPLDPDYPPDRLAFFLRDTAAVAVVAHRQFTGRLPADGPPVVAVDEALPGVEKAPVRTASPSSLAYALFTSGSTGTPKAVAVEHRNVLAYLAGLAGLIDQRPGDGYAMLQPLTFDFCVTMFYGALLSGGTLHLAPRDLAADAGFVAQLVRQAPIDHLKITPSHLAALRAAVSDPAELMPRRTLMLGGESSRWSWFADLRATRADGTGPAVVNHYGPTETTVGVLGLPGDRTPAHPTITTPIGWPLAHAQAYVLDGRRQPVPDGVVGELCVGGPQVTRGYLGRPDLTAERFLPDPFSSRPDARMYRTGDRVRRHPDGAVEFLGRFDDQVKVRGYRIELNEVRLALATHPQVDDCAVIVRDEQLVGYVVPARTDPSSLRVHLTGRLPEFMVPTTFVPLDELPLTPHGKLDRRRLPDPGGPAEDAPATDTVDAPRTATEEAVAALFGRLLDRQNVGRTDSFFALGGHSLLATQLVSRLRATFDRPVALRAVFERPTVAELARAIEETSRKGSRRLPQITPVPRDPAPVASYGQTRLWFLDQLEQAGQLYNTNLRLRLTGPIDATALRRALTAIVDRHEVLRTRLVRDGGQVVQVVVDPDLPFVELAEVDDLAEVLTAHGDRSFDLGAEPPIRVLFVRLAPDRHELLVTIHHAATDAWSAGIFVRELRTLYGAFRDGADVSPLPSLPVQYADFAVWQRDLVESRLRATQLAYWRSQLDGAPSRLPLHADRPAPARRTYGGGHVALELPAGVADRLRALGAGHDATLFMVLLAAFYALLARHSDATDLVVGTPMANRSRPDLESMIGFFLNTLVLRVDVDGDPTFVELVERVRRTTLDAYGNADVPFEALVDELQPERDLGGTPLVPVLFTLEDTERETGAVGDATISWEPMGTSLSRFDVSLFLWRRAGNLTGALEYRTDLFDRETVERLARDFTRLVTEAAADAGRPLSQLAPLSTEDTAFVEEASRGPVCEYPPLLPIRYAPGSVVVDEDGVEVTGAAFAGRVDGLAGRLVLAGVGGGSPVGISLPRGVDLLVAVHAVLRAGGAFVPLEPDFPDARLHDMALRAGAAVVVTDRANAPRWTDHVVVFTDETADGVDLPTDLPADGLAYVMFTSGSSGRPKGVGVSRGALANRLWWAQEVFGLTSADRVLVKTPFSFDVSVWELVWPLMVGASVVVARPGGHRDPAYLAGLGVSTVHFVPSMLEAFLDSGVRPSGWRRVLCSGEALSPSLVDRFFSAFPGVELFNLYGPTEAAIDVSWHRCMPGASVVPIGRPVANTLLEVRASSGERVPVGVPGELWIGGVQVADGYVGEPELTAERFVDGWYRTGDRARWLPSGEIEYLGRLDAQVKVRGQRIEPAEIEAAILAQPEATAAVVVAREARLVAYVVCDADTEVDWRARLRERLPEFMLPAVFVRLDALPLTVNGKLDRAALPAPTATDITAAAAPFTAPAGPAERAVADAYAAVLGLEPDAVGAHDAFFAFGGDSLTSLALVAKIRDLGYEVALADVFVHQTVRELAAAAGAAGAATEATPATEVGGGEAFGMVDSADLARLSARFGGDPS